MHRRAGAVTLVFELALLGILFVFPAQGQTFTVVHSFTNPGSEGQNPGGLVLDATDNLYGPTNLGGASNMGAVFKVDPEGKLTLLHSFSGPDGEWPSLESNLLLDQAGNLYGTTLEGGGACTFPGCGEVFRLDPGGRLTVLHGFTGGADGGSPFPGLVLDQKGNLYGTALHGGAHCHEFPNDGCGVVFKLDAAGNQTTLYSFLGQPDGLLPHAGVLLDDAGNFYGTTFRGGSGSTLDGCGIVFRLNPANLNPYTILHDFTCGADGANPLAGLVQDAAGNLYGTTHSGGDLTCGGGSGCGVVFKLDPVGNQTVLYAFKGGASGAFPSAPLVLDPAGNLFGTTLQGGNLSTCGGNGCGVAFRLDTAGNLTILHTFTGPDGANPSTGLLRNAAGNFYGTTQNGGDLSACPGVGCGVVFQLVFGADFALSASELTPGVVNAGGSSSATVNLIAVGGFSDAVPLSCTVEPSPPQAPTCSISPGSVSPAAPATLTVRTSAPTAALRPAPGPDLFSAFFFPLVGLAALLFCFGLRRKGRIAIATLACGLAAVLLSQFACSGNGGRVGGNSGTPSGTYTITVSGASSGSVRHFAITSFTVH